MKNLLLIILLAYSSWATTRIWDGSSNNKWSDTTNWSGGAVPTSSDSAIFNSTGNVACSLDVAASVLFLKIAASYTQTWKANGQTLTTVNGLNDSGITGAHILPDSIFQSGNGKCEWSSGIATPTSSNTSFYFGGVDTLTDRKGLTFKLINVKKAARVFVLGTFSSFSSANSSLRMEDSSYIYCSQSSGTSFTNTTDNGNAYALGNGDTISGNNTINFLVSANNRTLNIPALFSNGTPTLTFTFNTLTNCKYILTGAINAASANVSFRASSGSGNFFLDGYGITCATFNSGSTSAGGRDTLRWGTGVYNITSRTVNTTGISVDSMNSAKIRCAGNWTFGANNTVVPGTSEVFLIGSVAVTSNGKHFYDVRDSGTANNGCIFVDNVYIDNDFTAVAACAPSWSGFTMTIGGDLTLDNTSSLNFGNGITFPNASSLCHIGSTVGTVTASSCALNLSNSSGGYTLDDDKGVTFGGGCSMSGNMIMTGAGSTVFKATSVSVAALAMTNAGIKLTNNGIASNIQQATNNGPLLTTVGITDTLAGTAAIRFYTNGSGTFTIDTVVCTITGANAIYFSDGGGYGGTIKLVGPISGISTFGFNNGAAGTSLSILGNGYGIACSTLTLISSNATSVLNINWGSGVWNTASRVINSNTGIIRDTLSSATISCRGNWSNSTNASSTFDPGSSIVRATGTGTWTMAGKRFATWIDSTANTSTVTIADSLLCDSALYFKSGKFNQNSKVIYTRDYFNTSPDSVKMSANLNISRNYTRGATTLVVRTAGSMIFDTTLTTHSFTANSNQIGPVVAKHLQFQDSAKIQKLNLPIDSSVMTFKPLYGIRVDTMGVDWSGSTGKLNYFISATPNSQARLWIPKDTNHVFQYWRDVCVQGGTITCPWSSGCRSGGGGKCP